GSLTTTLAPASASATACERPMPRPAPVTIATLPFRSGIDGSLFALVAVEVVGARDQQPLGDVALDACERAGGHVAGPDPRRELPLLGVVLRRQLRELSPDDAERVQRHEHPEARAVVVECGEDLAGEELRDRLRELVRRGALAHFTPCRSRSWQISYSTSAPRRPRTASSTLRSCPVRWRC